MARDGGLLAGIAIAVKEQRPEVKVIGVQAEACAPVPASLPQNARKLSSQ